MSRLSRALWSLAGVALAGASGGQADPVAAPTRGNPPAVHVQAQSSSSVRSKSPSAAAPVATAVRRELLDQYCVTCHNEKLKTAGLMLDKVDVDEIGANPAVWEKVAWKLRTAQMPPVGRPRPDKPTIDRVVASLESALDRAALASPNPGRPTAHRLNRLEYVNAIRDLLALEIDGQALLPADDSSDGFDNNADVLSVTPALLNRYMSAATKISRLAIGNSVGRQEINVYKNSHFILQDRRVSEQLPFGTHGGMAVRHTFPVDGEYVLKINLIRSQQETIRGMEREHVIEARLDHVLLKSFKVGGEVTEGNYVYGLSLPSNDPVALKLHTYRLNADKHLEVRFSTKAGTRLVAAAFLNQGTDEPAIPEGVLTRPRSIRAIDTSNDQGDPGVDSIQITGPFNAEPPEDTPSRRRIFICRPAGTLGEAPCAKEILRTLARRAFRRPIVDADTQSLLRIYEAGRSRGGFEAGIEWALETILVDPEFLMRIERDPAGAKPGTVYRLTDLELASRLSFFLWSSIPDDELLQVAERGKLHEPIVLAQQVGRMLADPRATTFMNNFAGQWLLVRNTRSVIPDPGLFPDFDDTLREAMARETELFVESQIREDHSVLDLLRADYTFVNDRLAAHYGIPNIYGSHFRRVHVTDPRRQGLLGQGSVLTVTSYAHRTSVVLRGKWVLDNILGAPPPPPPPNVPALKENDEKGQPTSLRERMEQHRKNPVCATCHARIDPLGFVLENFDAVGRWRDTDAGVRIDAASTLADGTKLDSPLTFRSVLLARRDQFVRTVAEKLLTYALGRGLDSYDGPAVRQIARDGERNDDRWLSLILGVVKSTPFQMRRVPSGDAKPPAATTVAERE